MRSLWPQSQWKNAAPAGVSGYGDIDVSMTGAHAPDEYYVIQSSNPKIAGFDDAVMSYVEYLYQLAK